jgi:hypothetical protein
MSHPGALLAALETGYQNQARLIFRPAGPSFVVDQNLNPIRVVGHRTVFAHAFGFELGVIHAEMIDQIIAHGHGAGLREHQHFVGVAPHAVTRHDHREAERTRFEIAPGIVERLGAFELRALVAVEQLPRLDGEAADRFTGRQPRDLVGGQCAGSS